MRDYTFKVGDLVYDTEFNSLELGIVVFIDENETRVHELKIENQAFELATWGYRTKSLKKLT